MASKGKIFVVENEEIIRTLFCDLLGRRGYEVILARDGEEAIRKIKEEEFDVAIIDIITPIINGVEVFKMVKKIRPSAKVIMITAYAVDDLIRQAKEEGAYACIRKPFSIKEISDLIEEAMFGSKEGRE